MRRKLWLLVLLVCSCLLLFMPSTAEGKSYPLIPLKPAIPVKPLRPSPFGEQLWSKQVGPQNETAPAIGPDGTVYAHVVLGFLNAYHPDGTIKWTQSGFSYITSINVRPDGTIIVVDDDGLYAYTSDRQLKWSISLPYSTPPLFGDDGTIYVVTNVGEFSTLQAISPSGIKKWKFELDQTSSTAGGVIGADGTIYLGGIHGKLYAVAPKTEVTTTAASIGHLPPKTITRLMPTPHLKWKSLVGGSYIELALDPNGTLYADSGNHALYEVNTSTGIATTLFNANEAISQQPVIGADHTIYFSASDRMYAVNPDGTLKWSYLARGTITTAPILDATGRIYFGAQDSRLYVLNLDGAAEWKYKTGGAIIHTPVIDLQRPINDQPVYLVSDDGKLYAVKAPAIQ